MNTQTLVAKVWNFAHAQRGAILQPAPLTPA